MPNRYELLNHDLLPHLSNVNTGAKCFAVAITDHPELDMRTDGSFTAATDIKAHNVTLGAY